MRKKRGIVVWCFIAIVMGGCSTEEALQPEKETVKQETEEKGIQYKIAGKTEDELYEHCVTYEGTLRDFRLTVNPNDFFPKGEQFHQKDTKSAEGNIAWEGDKGFFLHVGYDHISCQIPEYFEKEYEWNLYDHSENRWKDLAEITKGETVTGITEEEAMQLITNITDKYKISLASYQVYPLSAHVLNILVQRKMTDEEYEQYLQEDKTNEPMKREYSKEEEVYLIIAELGVGDYVFFKDSYDYGKVSYCPSQIYALVGKEGIVSLDIGYVYEVKNKGKEISSILSLEEAKKKLEEKYASQGKVKEIVCTKIKMRYIAVAKNEKEYEFVPAYVFELEYPVEMGEGMEDYTERKSVLLDAETGDWVE